MGVLLDNLLEPLMPYFKDEEITDISINKPGEIWVDTGVNSTCISLSCFNLQKCQGLAQQIATESNQIISEENPILSAYLPGGERVQIVLSPAALWIENKKAPMQTVVFSIRKLNTANFDLSTYSKNGGFDSLLNELKNEQTSENKMINLYQGNKQEELLRYAVKNKQTILISGATYSGKTSFLNMLLKEIPLHERLITIEDVPELDVPHKNQVRLFYSRGDRGRASTQASDLVLSSLRMRPDRIILGELRGDDAIHWLAAANSGHPGTIATIHADEPKMALEKLALMVLSSQPNLQYQDVFRYIESIVSIIIQLKRNSKGVRYVSEIFFVNKNLLKTRGYHEV